MSDEENYSLTLNDLHHEQIRQSMILENLEKSVQQIHLTIIGDSDKRVGLVLEVDRLKRSRAMLHAVVVIVFTAAIGTCVNFISGLVIQSQQ